MALYVIADLHLSLGVDKPMDVFGEGWHDYVNRLRDSLCVLQPADTLVIPGDLSWGINLDEALADFQFLDRLPGRKLLVKGNHDLWWDTVAKMNRFFGAHDIRTISFLHNNAVLYAHTALCGTRGWFYEEADGSAHDAKIMNREIMRLQASLAQAKKTGADEILCFLHYPPIFGRYACTEILNMLTQYGVRECWYGHLHGVSLRKAYEGIYDGVKYTACAADHLKFIPIRIKN